GVRRREVGAQPVLGRPLPRQAAVERVGDRVEDGRLAGAGRPLEQEQAAAGEPLEVDHLLARVRTERVHGQRVQPHQLMMAQGYDKRGIPAPARRRLVPAPGTAGQVKKITWAASTPATSASAISALTGSHRSDRMACRTSASNSCRDTGAAGGPAGGGTCGTAPFTAIPGPRPAGRGAGRDRCASSAPPAGWAAHTAADIWPVFSVFSQRASAPLSSFT